MTNAALSHGVTLTGADECTDLSALAALVAEHDNLEIGILYTETPDGRPRYPSLSWIERAIETLPGRCALHVCGRGAREALVSGELASLVPQLRRVQVNGHVEPWEIFAFAEQAPIVIMQWQPGRDSPEFEMATERAQEAGDFTHQWLVDGSGGQGLLPKSWARPLCNRAVGFAGGLGPETLAAALPCIASSAEGLLWWWVDMESSLRTNDWFDLDRCRAALDAVAKWRRTLLGAAA